MSVVRVCPRGGVVRRTRRADAREGLPDRGHVTVQGALDEVEQVVGRPAVDRVRAQLPGEVLVVGPHPSGDREHHVEQPRHRLGGVEARLEGPAVAVALEGAVGEVHPAVEPVVVDQHAVGLLGRQRRLAAYGVGQVAAGAVEQHRRPGAGPAHPPLLGAERRDGEQVAPRPPGSRRRRGTVAVATGTGGLVGQHDHHVEVGVLGGVVARRGAAQHDARAGRRRARGRCARRASTSAACWAGESHAGHDRGRALTTAWAASPPTKATPRSTHSCSVRRRTGGPRTATSSHPAIDRPRISIGSPTSSSSPLLAVGRIGPHHQRARAAGGDGHVAVDHEADPAEHLPRRHAGSTPSSRSWMRCASTSSYAMASSMRLAERLGADGSGRGAIT